MRIANCSLKAFTGARSTGSNPGAPMLRSPRVSGGFIAFDAHRGSNGVAIAPGEKSRRDPADSRTSARCEIVRLSPRTNLLMFREWAPLQTAARLLEWAGLYGRVSVKGDCIGLAAVARIERNGRTSETGPPTFGQLPLGGTLTIPPLSRSDSSSQG
jgi:hypothetical protein